MKTIIFFVFISFYFSSAQLFAQRTDSSQIQNEENLIDLPAWFGNDEREKIETIEAQDSLEWSDYVQLAVSYAELGAEQSVVAKLIDKSLRVGTSESCNMLNFILNNRDEWSITKKYKKVVYTKLEEHDCGN